jgi:predicted dehydrogenase
MTTDERTPAGVIGVGSMGRHHARIYREHPEVELVGVTDEDREQAAAVAEEYGTVPRSQPELLSMAELVSVAVPTEAHYPVAKAAIEAGVSVLVEKPFVRNLANGRDLCRRAAAADVTLQVGHVERFNPAVQAMFDVVEDMNVIAIDARRLGPPLDRDLDDNVVMDLMIHDIDIVLASLDSAIASTAATAAHGGKHVVAQVTSGDGVVADLTASGNSPSPPRRAWSRSTTGVRISGSTASHCRSTTPTTATWACGTNTSSSGRPSRAGSRSSGNSRRSWTPTGAATSRWSPVNRR